MQDGQRFARVVTEIHEIVRNATERVQAAEPTRGALQGKNWEAM